MRRTVLIFTVDMIPVRNSHVSGGGLRAWGLGEALKEKGHEVVYSVPKKRIEGQGSFSGFEEYAFQPHQLAKIIRKVVPDVILFEQWGLATYLDETSIPVAIDLHGSLILENHYRHHQTFQSNVAAKIKSFAKADFLLCPSERQKSYFLPWLMLSGIPFDEKRIAVIPVSLSPNLPERQGVPEPTFVFGGALWPWIDPFPALSVVAEEIKAKEMGLLKLFSQKPRIQKLLPKDDSLRTHMANVEKLKSNDRVALIGFVPHEEMIKEYAGASVAVDLYQWNRERELAFSTRTIEFLWCGLPVIHADYSEISSHIREYQAGWCLNPNDIDGIKTTVSEILSDSAKVRRYAANAQKLVQDRFVWNKTVAPLDEFVTHPFPKTRKRTFFDLVSLEFDRIEEELEEENRKNKDALVQKDHELNILREKNQDNLKGRDQEIGRLNQECHKFRDHLASTQEAKNQLEGEMRDKLGIWQEEIESRDETIGRLDSEVNTLNGKIQERDEAISRLNVEKAGLLKLKNGLEGDAFLYKQEIISFREAIAERGGEIDDLRNALDRASEKAKHMDGVLRSIQNRFLYKLYKHATYRSKRLFLQYPRLLYLLIVNILTNTYMSRWCKKHRTKIFPAQ